MSGPVIAERSDMGTRWRSLPRPMRLRLASCAGWVVVFTLAYFRPLTDLMLLSIQSELNSYIPVVPFVAAYLLYLQRSKLPSGYRTSIVGTVILCVIGSATLLAAMRLNASLTVN